MVPADRLAAFIYLIVVPIVVYAMGTALWDMNEQRPVVTKDPHTGKLYIPRSDLTITGRHTRRHGQG